MRVPMKVDYGVRALVDLAQHYGQGAVQTSEIAGRQNIPESYLDQVLTTLGKSGFVRSRRGPQGGHVLAKPPQEITLDMVMTTLGGTLAPLDCLDDPSTCVMCNMCAQRDIWRAVEQAVHKVLVSTSVADLVRKQQAMSTQVAG